MNTRTAQQIANSIRLKRSLHKGSFLVVEGRDDRLFFGKFVDPQVCAIEVVHGKPNVIGVIRELTDSQFVGFLGVIDDDFDRVARQQVNSDNLIVLDAVALEALLVRSSALDRVLEQLGREERLQKFGRDVRTALVEAALPIGCLRLHSRLMGLGLKFSAMKYRKYPSADSLNVNRHALAQYVKNRSRHPGVTCDELLEHMKAIEDSVKDYWLVCSGADLIAVLVIGLTRTLGLNSMASISPELVRGCLRLAFSLADLAESKIHKDILDWTANNPVYQISAPMGLPDSAGFS